MCPLCARLDKMCPLCARLDKMCPLYARLDKMCQLCAILDKMCPLCARLDKILRKDIRKNETHGVASLFNNFWFRLLTSYRVKNAISTWVRFTIVTNFRQSGMWMTWDRWKIKRIISWNTLLCLLHKSLQYYSVLTNIRSGRLHPGETIWPISKWNVGEHKILGLFMRLLSCSTAPVVRPSCFVTLYMFSVCFDKWKYIRARSGDLAGQFRTHPRPRPIHLFGYCASRTTAARFTEMGGYDTK